MLVTHSLNLKEIQKEADNPKFMLANGTGSFVFLGTEPESRYNGLFFHLDSEMFKTIEHITPITESEYEEVINHFNFIERRKGHVIEYFFMPPGRNCMLYELDREENIEVCLDVKRAYDNREFGRYYDVEEIRNGLLFRFTKKTDIKEDVTNDIREYELYLVIYSEEMEYSLMKSWIRREYNADRLRDSPPFTRYVLDAVIINSKRLSFAASTDKEKAIKEAQYCYREHPEIRQMKSESKAALDEPEVFLAYESAKNSLKSLVVSDGIFAGLPWFFQFWSRDELLCLKALMKDEDLVKHIISKWLRNISDNGRIQNRIPSTETQSADSTGLLFLRVWDLLRNHSLSKKELLRFRERLEHSMYLLLKHSTYNDFEANAPQQSWMDSGVEDGRAGIRIEIQALRLAAYETMYHLDWNHRYVVLKDELKHKVRSFFFRDGNLADGVDDFTARPNVFLAAYYYPDLLSKEEWIKVFENILPKLWLEWGGLSTIDKNDYRFKSNHTGENPASYHNGDSWFFVNNIAAIVMARLNRKRFRRYIHKIIEASTHEILWMGAIGHAAELSSASELKSEGSPVQAWSAATYIELVEELY